MLNRKSLIDWYRATRARTRQLFDIITPDAYYDRPIALRNPIVFYEGHLPAFSVNTLVKLTLKKSGIHPYFEQIFERGIDPENEAVVKSPTDLWPAREDVQAYGLEADALIERTLCEDNIEIDGGEAAGTIIEHELMHQETLLYMFHELPYSKRRASGAAPASGAGGRGRPPLHRVNIPAGRAILGAPRGSRFGWDNEFPELVVDVPAFEIDAYNVTNGDYLEYIEATGAKAPHFWQRVNDQWHRRGLFELAPLPMNAPVYVTHEEATAYANWKGARLPSEAEWHRASGEGDEIPEGNYDFQHWDPVDVGSYAPNEYGIYDLVGNGWEWTSTPFGPFPGFEPMPSYRVYSADFFDNAHFVLKGASPVTARELVRKSFRNWFRPNYPYVYASFRCAR
ncbi:MAG: ergothioneine biosynthesis protein EgtB [Acidobacteria bacterium]|nr:MAG: ergothioneine biosynthesis protein EgtB [Acidobacteriota bacterium]